MLLKESPPLCRAWLVAWILKVPLAVLCNLGGAGFHRVTGVGQGVFTRLMQIQFGASAEHGTTLQNAQSTLRSANAHLRPAYLQELSKRVALWVGTGCLPLMVPQVAHKTSPTVCC